MIWVTSRDELAPVATGALLHDIGKRHVPFAVLNKPAKPTEEEWVVIRKHPTDGYHELCNRPDLIWGQLMMVYQHHERLDGSGYPAGRRPTKFIRGPRSVRWWMCLTP